MAAPANTSKMPRVMFKEMIEKVLKQSGVKVVEDGFKTGVKKQVQAMVTQTEETYERPQLNSSALIATLNITTNIFSEINETGVHEAILKLMSLNASSPNLPTYRIKSFRPTSSGTQYVSESSQGHVDAYITLEIIYFM